MELARFLEFWDCQIILEFSKEVNMERYKSIVKSVVVNGARHAFLLQDGTTWVSVFFSKGQKPEFQQAIRGVAQGQEYIFDCFRNERQFLNIIAIQHPTWPAPIQAKDVQPGAPPQPTSAPPPMPGPLTVPPMPQAQAPVQPVNVAPPAPPAPTPLPPPQPAPEPPPTVTLDAPATPPPSDQPPIELTEPTEVSLKEKLIARENAATNSTALLCAIIDKGALPEDVESFITWVGVKFVQVQDIISSNTLKLYDPDNPF